MPRITQCFLYPVKGMRGVSHESFLINHRTGVEGDRNIALAKNPEQSHRTWAEKTKFYVGMNTAAMVAQTYHDLISPDLRTRVPALAAGFKVVNTDERFNLTDTQGPTVTLLNLATYRLFEDFLHQNGHLPVGQPLNPERFRMNVQVDDWAPFAELTLPDAYPGTRQITIGDLRFEVHDACERCKATHANPATGTYDLDTLKLLRQFMDRYQPNYKSPHRKHNIVMGLILKPLDSGPLKLGDELLT